MADLNTAHIWGAKFPSSSVRDAICEEQYEDDQAARSRFGASQDEWFYDHDSFYVEGVARRGIEGALEEAAVPAKNIERIVEAWFSADLEEFDSIVVGDEEDFSNPTSCEIDGAKFKYLGLFPHWSTKGTKGRRS